MINHYEKVESRRVELIHASAEQEKALLSQISDAKRQALDLRTEENKFACDHHFAKANDAKAAAARLEERARQLTNVDLPRLRVEAENLRQNRHSELAILMKSAELHQRAAEDEQKRQASNAVVAAKAALNEHLAATATKQTIALARALADAAQAAGVGLNSTVRSLLDSKKAA